MTNPEDSNRPGTPDAKSGIDAIKHVGGLVGVAIRQPVFTTMIMIGLMVLGLFSFLRLSIDQFPDISIPIVAIQTTYPGASPETVEREVTKRIEEAVNPTQGLKKITSVSLEGVSSITAEFDLGVNVDAATADVRSKIEQIRRELPGAIDQPVVQQFDPAAAPILSLALSSEATSIGDLTNLADNSIRRSLESVSGVGRVQITGGVPREVHVLLDPTAMQALNVSVAQVMTALQQQNLDIPAGRIESQNREELVRVLGRIESPEQFGRIIVADRDGSPVRLSRIATIADTTEEARSMALVDGKRAIGIDLLKVSGANTVDVANQVMKVLPKLRSALPAGASLTVIRDNSVQIQQSVTGVVHELVIGAILTVIIVFLFLGDWRATAITAFTLPVSVISTFILLNVLGFTLNILTLMALSLSIGILIDDAIVVIENIVRRRQMGEDHFVAAATGTQEIFLAVMATTLTLVAVFVPVAFMGGIIGKFFYQFGMTIAWAVLVSLFVSFTLTPMLSAWWTSDGEEPHGGHGGAGAKKPGIYGRFRLRFDEVFDRLAHGYRRVIVWALGHRRTTVITAGVSFVLAIGLFPLVGGAFMPDQDNGEFSVSFKTATGSSLAYSESKAREVASVLRGLPGVDFTYASVGAGATGSVTKGEVYVKLKPRDERSLSQQELMPIARTALAVVYGTEVSVLVGGGLGGAAKPIQIAVRGPDFGQLQTLSERIMEIARNAPGAIEVESSVGEPKPEVQLRVDIDRANDLGLDVSGIANTVRPLLAGQVATQWEDQTGEERDVIVRVPSEDRTTADKIASLPIATTHGDSKTSVPLGQVARLEKGTGPAQIDHESLQRVITVSANLGPNDNLQDVSDGIQSGLDALELPAGYTASMGGDTEQLSETVGFVIQSLLLAIVLIYLILASQFGSFTQPFAIMLALPLSLVGVMVALLLTGDTMNIMSMIGIILLMGLVTKNAILLVDNANQHREGGMGREDSLAEAGAIRLRPILMTTLAMIFGMVPIALGTGEGGEFRAPMARAVIGGLITSTLLTLIVVPVVYTYFEDFSGWFSRKVMRRGKAMRVAPATELAPVSKN